MAHKTTHGENLMALKRVEGQVKGLQKMIEKKAYCIDIANQVHACIGALYRVSEKILVKHMEHCVVDALRGRSEKSKREKIDEIMKAVMKIHKIK